MFSSKRSTVIAAGAAAALIAAVAACGSSASGTAASGSTPASAAASSSPDGGPGSGGAANARSGPAAGGSAGTITSVSTTGFTLTTAAGEKVTVTEASATNYQKGTSTATAAAVTTGQPVLVLGTTDSTTITAAQVIVQPPATSGSNPGGQVISFTKGKQGSTTKVGQIPADYTQGTGTLVSGTTADKAIEAALAAYPGGVVDRVVALGGGQYEVHYIGVNWPHHIFVNQNFHVTGVDD
jgi:membrane-bound inhibitor of C-type lysozyme